MVQVDSDFCPIANNSKFITCKQLVWCGRKWEQKWTKHLLHLITLHARLTERPVAAQSARVCGFTIKNLRQCLDHNPGRLYETYCTRHAWNLIIAKIGTCNTAIARKPTKNYTNNDPHNNSHDSYSSSNWWFQHVSSLLKICSPELQPLLDGSFSACDCLRLLKRPGQPQLSTAKYRIFKEISV